ncbi:MAG: STAS domain-containing protein [Deltaproteobacteria bacterium]|nr:STAS domain-containing protein [Deltaproteobacteria bacterium]
MEIKTKKEKNTVIVSVKGRMDAVTSPEFEKSLSTLIAAGENDFLINLHQLEYISSAGLRSILTVAKLLKTKDGKILFAALQGPVKDVFNISGFGAIFKIHETEEEALKAE